MLRQILREISVENNSSGNNTNSGSNSSGSCGNNSGGNNTNSGANNSVSRGNNSDNSGNNVSRGNNSGGSNTKSGNNSNCQQCCRMTPRREVSREMLDLLEQLINWLPQNPNKARTSGPEVHLRPVIILTLPSMNVLFDPRHCGQVAAIKDSHIQVVEERRSLLGHVISMTAILNTTILASTSVFLIGSNVKDDIVPAPQDDPVERTVSNTDNSRNNSISHGNNSGDNKTNSGANNSVSRGNNSGVPFKIQHCINDFSFPELSAALLDDPRREVSQEMLDLLEQLINWLSQNPNKGRRSRMNIRKPFLEGSNNNSDSCGNNSDIGRNNSVSRGNNSGGNNSVSCGNNSSGNNTNVKNGVSHRKNSSGNNSVSRENYSGGTKPTAAATTASAVEIAAAAKTVSAVETTASSVERTAAATTPTAVAKTV
ncbi:putative uncharacterized protein DDB_G0286901 [Eleutherodactylus coqui]|uniref:putative uncharacterized protein DDB_G0286901 n=1 Tax=Eleutherodactylus coqui TaxID=57060 RepID=UPI0034619D3B